MRKAFTIVELMMVIAIIAILATIVTTAASSSIKQARKNKANAIARIVEQGLATYYAQKGQWPISVDNMGADGDREAQATATRELDGSQVRECVRKICQETKEGNPMLDVSGLFVSSQNGEGGRQYGLDFMSAIHGVRKQNPRKMKLNDMYFGYPEADHGWFRRLRIVYHLNTDQMKVVLPY